MMKRIIFVAAMLASQIVGEASPFSPQIQPCNMPLAQAPVVRGFKLGMTAEQARASYDYMFSYPEPDETGFFKVRVIPMQLAEPLRNGLRSLGLAFFDNRLVTIEVWYDDTVAWASAEQFAGATSKSLGLPNRWVKTASTNEAAPLGLNMPCGETAFGVTSVFGTSEPFKSPVLFVYERGIKQVRDERRAKVQEMKRRSFKP